MEETLWQQLQLLKRPGHRRSPQDLKTLVSSFSKLKFFQELDASVRTQVCRFLKLDSFPAGTTIFREGEPGDKFYIILSGSVAVYIQDQDHPTTNPSTQDAGHQHGSNAQEPSEAAPPRTTAFAAADAEGDTAASPACASEQTARGAGAGSIASEAEHSEAAWQKRSRCLLEACRLGGNQATHASEDTNRHLRLCLAELCAGHEGDANDWLRSRHLTPALETWASVASCLQHQTASSRKVIGPHGSTLSAVRRGTCPGPKNEADRGTISLKTRLARSKSTSGVGLSSKRLAQQAHAAQAAEGEREQAEEVGEEEDDDKDDSDDEASSESGGSSSSRHSDSVSSRKHASDFTGVPSDEDELATGKADLDASSTSGAENGVDNTRSERERRAVRRSIRFGSPEVPPGHRGKEEGQEDGASSTTSSRRRSKESKQSRRQSYRRQYSAPRRSTLTEKKTLAVVLKAGEAFGEVALQTDQPRTATVKTVEHSYFATLLRDDFKSILCTTVEQQRQDRFAFIQELPLFYGFSVGTVRKLSALMQRRILARNESVYEYGTPVLHIFLARHGEFAVSCRVTDLEFAIAEEAQTDNSESLGVVGPNAGGRNGAPGGLKLREEIAIRQRAQLEAERQNKEDFIVVALLTPPSAFGLSSALRGEKRHRTRVVCQSTTGTIYSLVAKELVTHFLPERRNQLQELACAQDSFHENRMMVLRRLAFQRDARPKDAYPRQNAKRFWPREQTLLERLEAARTELTGPCAVYSLQGRLQSISACFRSEAGTEPPAEIAPDSGEEKKEKEKEGSIWLKPAWKIQEAGGVVFDPYAAAARAEGFQKRTQDTTLQAAMKNNVFHMQEDKPYSDELGIPAPQPRSPPEFKRARQISNALSVRHTASNSARSLSRIAEAAASQAAEEIGEPPSMKYTRAVSKGTPLLSPSAAAGRSPRPASRSPGLHLPPVVLSNEGGEDGGGQQAPFTPVPSSSGAPLSPREAQDGSSLPPPKMRGRKTPQQLSTFVLSEVNESARSPMAKPKSAKEAISAVASALASPRPEIVRTAQASAPVGLGPLAQSDPWSCGLFSEELIAAALAPEGLFAGGSSSVMGANTNGPSVLGGSPRRPPEPPAVPLETVYRRPGRREPVKPPAPEPALSMGMSLRVSITAV